MQMSWWCLERLAAVETEQGVHDEIAGAESKDQPLQAAHLSLTLQQTLLELLY